MKTKTKTPKATNLDPREKQYQEFIQAGEAGTLKDDANPVYLFSTTWTDLLLKIVSGEVDAQFMAYKQLKDRGLDLTDGAWVGFEGHGRYENLLKKHRVELYPVQVIEGALDSNKDEWSDVVRQTIGRIISAMKAGRKLEALEMALVGGATIKFFALNAR